MARFLVLVGLCVCFSYLTVAQQCDQQIKDFQDCQRQSMKKPGQGQGGGDRPNFAEIKTKSDQCFTSNNCDAPKFGGGPRGGSSGEQSGGRGGSEGGRAGGRAGRVNSGASAGNNDDRRKCFQAVGNKTKDYMTQCIRKADPSFDPTKQGDHHGPAGGFGGPGGPGGHHGGMGDHEGGPGGAGHMGGQGRQGGQDFLLQACKNNAANAEKVKTCMKDVFQQQKPDESQMRKAFDEHCAAKKSCEAKLGACKSVLENRRAAACTCGQEAMTKRQEFMQQEASCSSIQQPQGSNRGPGGPGGPRQGKEHNCNAKLTDYCAQGFDAILKARPAGGSHHN